MSALSTLAPQDAADNNGFEGCEKKLVIQFSPSEDLRTISRAAWDAILLEAKCEIISKTCNEYFDAYVLSESSLFVYPTEIMIKTCGTTALLHAIPSILRVTEELGVNPVYVQFSRSNFLFPEHQPFPHRTFSMEVAYLNTFFECGKAHILGPLNGPRWHIYIANISPRVARDQTLEVIMFDLDQTAMMKFYKQLPRGTTGSVPKDGPEATAKNGIDMLLPGATIDSFLFDPCGYSCNGLLDRAYFTIHVTPEPQCSFVSFETNARLSDYTELVRHVLDIFKPGTWSAAICARTNAGIALPTSGISWNFNGHNIQSCTAHRFEHGDNVRVGHFIAQNSVESKKAPAMQRLSSLQRLSDQLYDDSKIHVLPYQLSCVLGREQLQHHVQPLVNALVKIDQPANGASLSEVAQRHIQLHDPEGTFVVTDLGVVLDAYRAWSTAMPTVAPCFTLQHHNDKAVLMALGSLGCSFNIQTVAQASLLLNLGVLPDQIIFANPWKPVSHLNYAVKHQILHLTVDSVTELRKIHKHVPKAQLVLNLALPLSAGHPPRRSSLSCSVSEVPSSETIEEFHGATKAEARAVLVEAAALGVKIVGISFNGEGYAGDHGLGRRVQVARVVLDAALELGHKLDYVDFGELRCVLAEHVQAVTKELRQQISEHFLQDSDLRLMARPSSLLVGDAQFVVARVLGRKEITVVNGDENQAGEANRSGGMEGKSPNIIESRPGASTGYAYYVSPTPALGTKAAAMEGHKSQNTCASNVFPSAVFSTGANTAQGCLSGSLPELQVDDWVVLSGLGSSAVPTDVAGPHTAGEPPCYVLRLSHQG